MDVKEAVAAAAPRYASQKMPKDQAERVVEGAMHLSPHLGKRMVAGPPGEAVRLYPRVAAAGPQGRDRAVDRSGRDEGRQLPAGVVGKAHARQMDEATRTSWFKELERNRSKTLEAPSWLWSSVVSLIGSHEVAYLEHCRKYATQVPA